MRSKAKTVNGKELNGNCSSSPPGRWRMTDRITVLAALPWMAARSSLEAIFERCRWQLHLCRSCADIRSQLDCSPGVALTADHLRDGDWKDVLVDARRLRVAPPLIVASHVPDARLWSEVLHLGGYDVLTIPFLAREVILSISLAWRRWHDQWTLASQDPMRTSSAGSAALRAGHSFSHGI